MHLQTFISAFASAMREVDARGPVASNVRSGALYQPGLGPHTERQTVSLVMSLLQGSVGYALEVPYPNAQRSKCDVVISRPEAWSIEFKMLRLMGDNGKPNDNILMHILSPYPEHRSALTDTEKLLRSGLPGRKAIVIYGYDYPEWPMEPAIAAFEVLAHARVKLGERVEARNRRAYPPCSSVRARIRLGDRE